MVQLFTYYINKSTIFWKINRVIKYFTRCKYAVSSFFGFWHTFLKLSLGLCRVSLQSLHFAMWIQILYHISIACFSGRFWENYASLLSAPEDMNVWIITLKTGILKQRGNQQLWILLSVSSSVKNMIAVCWF